MCLDVDYSSSRISFSHYKTDKIILSLYSYSPRHTLSTIRQPFYPHFNIVMFVLSLEILLQDMSDGNGIPPRCLYFTGYNTHLDLIYHGLIAASKEMSTVPTPFIYSHECLDIISSPYQLRVSCLHWRLLRPSSAAA